ncbi:MAG: oligo-alginate lyase, partial [Humisphaera sp.]|nr:oligo-alginate lyase [Humisphaera sp.]
MKLTRALAAVFSLLITTSLHAAASAPATQRASAFYPPQLLQRIRANADKDDWGRDIRKRAIDAAEPWRKMSDEQLWQLVFGATIPRSWHVFSNGHCPSCQKPVPMYDWKIDALKISWKVRCPHCQELFPKNDFEKFYTSGRDEHGVFDPKKADRALLVNVDHAGAVDPKRTFGVDDGEGFVQGDKRWRFIQTYLVYGQWKQRVEGGVKALATAYVLTGDKEYAHRAGVLLDRIADVYPTFDFRTQGILYENVRADGYVSVWHDATIETRELALSYDAVKDALAQDDALATFLAGKAQKFKPPLPKNSPADILTNIEQRILRDALANPQKIYSNFPQQQLTTAVIHTALGWPENRAAVLKMLEPVIEQSTAVDGTTGEKGLAGYSAYAAQRLGEFLGYYARMDDKFLAEMIQRHPRLPQMYRFFIDTWIAERYYPTTGDTHWFAGQHLDYAGLSLSKDHMIGSAGHSNALLTPSMYTFLWQLYQATRDPAFAQVLYQQNDRKIDGLPFDLFQSDPAAMQRELKSVIDENGAELKLQSVNKQQWHLAVLRSGKGDDRRAVWLDYDSGGQHGHMDGMNLGLVARGLDLMPDFGYPPVQFGGWDSPRANWYKSAWSHNTVVV